MKVHEEVADDFCEEILLSTPPDCGPGSVMFGNGMLIDGSGEFNIDTTSVIPYCAPTDDVAVTTLDEAYDTQMSRLKSVSSRAIHSVWGRVPRGFQTVAVPNLLKMGCRECDASCVLLVQGTGTGKSAVPQTVGVVLCGVTLIIENTLSLGKYF